jgi:hypothetical protein
MRASAFVGAKKFGRSQPIFEPNSACCASSRSYSGERRSGRAESSSRFGHGIM